MKDVRVDERGEFRCWNCGGTDCFTEKRTFRSKALLGVGALLTHKKLKCQVCDEYNDTGSAKPYTEPADRKWRKRRAEEAVRGAPSAAEVAEALERLVALRDAGVLSEDELAEQKAKLLGA